MIAARRKKINVSFDSYKSGKELASIYNSLSSSTYKDTSLMLQTLYLLSEIATKKLALHFNLDINIRSYSINGYFEGLRGYNKDLDYFIRLQASRGRYRLLQLFDYGRLRFDSNIHFNEYLTIEEMVKLFEILFEWLKVVERQRGL